MLTIKAKIYFKKVDLRASTIICPKCLNNFYVFENNVFNTCFVCDAPMLRAVRVVKGGILGRLDYFNQGWPEMDKLNKKRLLERKIAEG